MLTNLRPGDQFWVVLHATCLGGGVYYYVSGLAYTLAQVVPTEEGNLLVPEPPFEFNQFNSKNCFETREEAKKEANNRQLNWHKQEVKRLEHIIANGGI
jgi:hypothetical protein